MTIGEKIKRLRIHTKLTQKKLGELSSTSEITIRQYESGKRQPRIEQLKKIAKVFDFPLYLLLDDDYELGDVELEMNRAKPFKSYEIVEPPSPFTVPLSQYNNGNNIYKNLHEIAMQKELNREASTDGEKQTSIGIPVRSRKRTNDEDTDYDPLSYENSYSFASSEDELNKYHKQQRSQDKETSKKLSQFADSDNNTHKYDAAIRINHNLSSEDLENLKEINRIYKKIENKENLTKDELQMLKDDNERQKTAMKRLRETLQTMQEKLIPAYEKLNKTGQEEAAKRIEELTEIPRYTKAPEPPQE